MRKVIILIVLFVFSHKGIAGWFECYNYSGELGQQSIDLSIQFLGDKRERVEGVYKYNRINTPIQLVGLERNGDTIKLNELNNDVVTGKITLIIKGDSLVGTWVSLNNLNKFPINLTLVSKLVDTLNGSIFSDVDLLFRQSTKKYYFVGIYSLQAEDWRASMSMLNVIDKTTNKIAYQIDFSKNELLNGEVGNVMTVIYENVVSTLLDKNGKLIQIRLTANLGRMGCDFPLNYKFKSDKFLIDENDLNSYAP
jgi:hypothetical protein